MDFDRTGRTLVPGAIISGRTQQPGEPGLDKMLEVVATGPEPVGSHCFLLVVAGVDPGRLYPLDRPEMLIGRSKYADLRINEHSISQQHAKLVRFGDHHRIFDLGSTNGTYVNNQRVDEADLRPGDAVRTGETVFTYMGQSTSAGASPESTIALPGPPAGGRTRPPAGALPPAGGTTASLGALARRGPATMASAIPAPRVFDVAVPRPSEEEADLLTQILRVIAFFQRYWLSILIFTALGAAGGVVVYKVLKPASKAEFEVSLVPQASDNPLAQTRRLNFEFFRSAAQNFVRPSLIVETLRSLGEENVSEDRVRAIQRRLEFQRTGEFSYAGAFVAPNAEDATKFLEVHLKLYLDNEVDKAIKTLMLEVETLEQRLAETDEQLTSTEQALFAFRKENSEGLPEQQEQLYSELIALGSERGRAASEVARTAAMLRLSQQRLKNESPIIESRLDMARPYEAAIADTRRELAEAKAANKGSQHVDVIALKAKLQQLEELRDRTMAGEDGRPHIDRTKNPLYKDARLDVDSAEASHAIATAELARTTQDLERTRTLVAKLPELQAEYSELTRSYEATKKTHDELFEKLSASRTQLDMERVSIAGRFDILTPPNVKVTPWIKTLLIRITMGMIAGFALGVFIGLLRDLRRTVAARLAAQRA